MREIILDWQVWTWGLVAVGAAIAVGSLAHFLLWWALRRLARRTAFEIDDSFVRHCRRPSALILPILAVYLTMPAVRSYWSEDATALASHVLMIALTVAVAWLLIRMLSVAEDFVARRYDVTVRDNLDARRVHTQFQVLRKIAIAVVLIIAFATAMMSFDSLRQVGLGILASAGVVGLVVGFAAQKTLANLLAGIQIALTQPVRLDDVVIVEGEWGRVEEITLTYVVVRIWDLRRLVLPIGYFLEKPFQNWTRVSSDILGTVYLYVDYTVPVSALRAKLDEIVKQSEDWDGKVCGVQVTNATSQTVEIRALMSAEDASKAWNLRCRVREELITFLQQEYPGSLPRVRAVLEGSRAEGTTPS